MMDRAVPSRPPISVLLACDRPCEGTVECLASISAQFLRDDELVVVDHGREERASPALKRALGAGSRRCAFRLLETPGLNLAGALNAGLHAARHGLVARMDADDLSLPGRFDAQAAFLSANPEVVAVGTAIRRLDHSGSVIVTDVPPTDPREVRWRMLVENCLAHGSVMMRRDGVLGVGGYDPACEKAQDYDLWLRLLERRGAVIANLPDPFYAYRCDRRASGASGWRSSAEQASVAARALMRAWAALPPGDDDAELRRAMAGVLSDPNGGAAAIERLLTEHGPTRARMQAWGWARHVRGAVPMGAVEAGRRALLREVGCSVRAAGINEVWLWGAGRHSAWLLANLDHLGLRVVGIVDDHSCGSMFQGIELVSPDELDAGTSVLLSSDTREEQMWASSAAARARGVRVWRLYAANHPQGDVRGAPGESSSTGVHAGAGVAA